jgi:hypothetical protein
MRYVLSLSILALCFALPCYAEMDWEHLILKESAPDQSQAVSLLKPEFYSLQYDATKTVGDFIQMHSDREQPLVAQLSDYKQLQFYLTDGTVEYAFHLPVTPGLITLLLPTTQPVQLVVPMLCPHCGQDWPAEMRPPEGLQLTPKEIEKTDYTGIIIDCRDTQLTPCLFPKVFDEKLQEVYSINFAAPQYVIERGLITYMRGDVVDHQRLGDNPLRISALDAVGDKQTDIRISASDARRIHGSKNNLDLLRECRVAIIFGQ